MSADTTQIGALNARIAVDTAQVAAATRLAVRRATLGVQADAQGMAPVDTGALKGSISSTFTGSNAFSARGEVGPTVEYGSYVEDGTSRMAAQPYMGPAFERQVPVFLAAVSSISTL